MSLNLQGQTLSVKLTRKQNSYPYEVITKTYHVCLTSISARNLQPIISEIHESEITGEDTPTNSQSSMKWLTRIKTHVVLGTGMSSLVCYRYGLASDIYMLHA